MCPEKEIQARVEKFRQLRVFAAPLVLAISKNARIPVKAIICTNKFQESKKEEVKLTVVCGAGTAWHTLHSQDHFLSLLFVGRLEHEEP